MEEERGFGNIIFYIILAIIAIVSSIKGKKKQQPGIPGGSKPSEAGRSYFPDELFEEDVESAPEKGYWEETHRREPVIEAPGRTAAVFSKGTEGKHEKPVASMVTNEGVSALDHLAAARKFEELLKETSINDDFDWDESEQVTKDETIFDIDQLSEEFDGRQAVILSEIINRREY